MPDQRESSKKVVTFWLTPEEKKNLEEAARKSGVNMTEFFRIALRKWLDSHSDDENGNKEK